MDEKTLPEDFNGVFYFTNFTGADFTAKWDSVEYTFPAMKTVPLLIPNANPYEIQNIRKKFALELATAIFYDSDKFKSLDISVADSQAGKTPALYTETDLAPYIQRCLEPLPTGQAKSKAIPKKEIPLSVDDKGNPLTKIVSEGESLIGQGGVIG